MIVWKQDALVSVQILDQTHGTRNSSSKAMATSNKDTSTTRMAACAQDLLDQQPLLRYRLLAVMRDDDDDIGRRKAFSSYRSRRFTHNATPSEKNELRATTTIPTASKNANSDNNGSFARYIHHVRNVLSRSPSTLLRQSLELAFAVERPRPPLRRNNDTNNEQQQQQRHQSFLELTKLVLDTTCSPASDNDSSPAESVFVVGQFMDKLSPGSQYRRLQSAKQSLQQEQNESMARDQENILRSKIAENLTKTSRKNNPNYQQITDENLTTTTTTTGSKDTPRVDEGEIKERLERAMRKLRTSRARRIQRLQSLIQCWEASHDSEYERYCRARQMWRQCGGEQLWTNYQRVNLAISKQRDGLVFEAEWCDVLFAMIVRLLEGRENSHKAGEGCDYWYERGSSWWHKGVAVGELDMVVHYKERGVVAVCEIKSACFELGVALRQHEAKLADCAACSHNQQDLWKIGTTLDVAISVSGREIPLFLATRLPRPGEHLLRTEPLLLNAICEGIRAQGRRIVRASNRHLCWPLLDILEQSDIVSDNQQSSSSNARARPVGFVQEAIDYLEGVSQQRENDRSSSAGNDIADNDDEDDDGIDCEQLLQFVVNKVGPEQLMESPLAAVERFPPSRLLVLPPTET